MISPEWIARLTSHIPDRGTQFVHYYGAYSNAHRGVARRRESFVDLPSSSRSSITSGGVSTR
jgi:hypothetical protein